MANKNLLIKEKDNFLSTLHTLIFSQTDKNDAEVADLERRCLAMKYFTAKAFDSEDAASIILRKGLKDYRTIVDDQNGLSNYWKQFEARNVSVNNDPLQWQTSLNDPNLTLELVKPLSCQKDKTLACAKKCFTDNHIEKLINKWTKSPESIRRKQPHKSVVKDFEKLSFNSDELKQSASNTFSNCKASHQYQNTDKNDSIYTNNSHKNINSTFSRDSGNRESNRAPKHFFQTEQRPKNVSIPSIAPKIDQSKGFSRVAVSSKQQNSSEFNKVDVKDTKNKTSFFKSATEMLSEEQANANKAPRKKTLGGKDGANSKFVCPFKREREKEKCMNTYSSHEESNETFDYKDERLKNIEPKMIELVKNEIMDSGSSISWDDIAGLQFAKKIIKEVVVLPMLRPDIFTGLRRPPKGILLFGPPGTGKTLIGKCIASQSKSTFFSISASSLTSKWIGEGEKMVRALFAVAKVEQPSVIFIDEIDSLLSQRSETEHESSRRIKTEFLVQLDGAATAEEDRILIVGATNRPHELDEAARRRLVKRLYIPLPELEARQEIIHSLLKSISHNLTEEEMLHIAEQSNGYSGADMANLCKEASMEPIRCIPFSQLENISKDDVRHVTVIDFQVALQNVRPSVSQSDLTVYLDWDKVYGSGTSKKS